MELEYFNPIVDGEQEYISEILRDFAIVSDAMIINDVILALSSLCINLIQNSDDVIVKTNAISALSYFTLRLSTQRLFLKIDYIDFIIQVNQEAIDIKVIKLIE